MADKSSSDKSSGKQAGSASLSEIQRHLKKIALIFLVVFCGGTLGFYFLAEGNPSILECAYMTMITLAAVGYEEIVPVKGHQALMIYTIFLILIGVGLITYSVSVIAAYVIEGAIEHAFWRRKMVNRIKQMDGHFIVCGAGEVGLNAVKELVATHRDCVVIESDQERIDELNRAMDICFIEGDASSEETLVEAGLDRAGGLLASLPNDKDNLFLVLTARQLNPRVRIVSECVNPDNNAKFMKAGADSVVSPQAIGGLRLVSEMIRPSVVGFLDHMLRDHDKAMRIEEVTIGASSPLKGQTCGEAQLRERYCVQALALRRPNEKSFSYIPAPEDRLDEGTTIVVMADVQSFHKLREVASG